jgi:predicted permease
VGGTAWIAYFRHRGVAFSWPKFFRELLRFPPFVAVLAAYVLALFPPFPADLQIALERLGSTLVPVAMVSVGASLDLNPAMMRTESRGLAWGLGFKMLLTPIFFGLLSYYVFQLRGEVFAVALLESAMAPMITATVLGMEAGFAPGLGALMLGVGIPLSLLTVPLFYQIFIR